MLAPQPPGFTLSHQKQKCTSNSNFPLLPKKIRLGLLGKSKGIYKNVDEQGDEDGTKSIVLWWWRQAWGWKGQLNQTGMNTYMDSILVPNLA